MSFSVRRHHLLRDLPTDGVLQVVVELVLVTLHLSDLQSTEFSCCADIADPAVSPLVSPVVNPLVSQCVNPVVIPVVPAAPIVPVTIATISTIPVLQKISMC